jgi:HAD superfamily hydrolase (TIGR01549 family)
MSVRAVFFDVGETLVDETRVWAAWADWLGVPRLTFFGVLGGLIQRGEPLARVFEPFRPNFDLKRERAAREAAGFTVEVGLDDLYPDALPCLAALRSEGYAVGIAGNQPVTIEPFLRQIAAPSDIVATSEGLGVGKPEPEFFDRIVSLAALPLDQIAYVGDRVDNDVVPATAAGMVAVFLRRGPWGYLQADRPEADRAQIKLDSLADLPAALRAYREIGGIKA